MPLYEYLCSTCGIKFEALRSYISADSPIACSSCGSQKTKRQLSTFFSHSQGRIPAASSSGCGSCSGGSCGTCRH